ncbi:MULTISPECIES: flavoprotein [unclassified Streptosporangium]|uniref:flavoprotein n=1 Tax=Streptosporangium sp. NPDC005286 TaxID=3154463 RepID=UPI0033A75D6C
MSEAGQPQSAPSFRAERLLVLVTGSLNATFVPYWFNWLRLFYPCLDIRAVVTRSAERFVTRQSLASILNKDVPLDVWPDVPKPGSPHVDYASWPDTVLVYPATYHFLSRFANGFGDTPMLLALQCTSALIGIAPAVPPNAIRSYAYQQHQAAIKARPNVAFVDPVLGISAHTREESVAAAAPLPTLIERLEKLRAIREKEAR